MASYSASMRGLHDVSVHRYTSQMRGKYNIQQQLTGKMRGFHRLENDALDVYELYRGSNAEPDFTASPFETFSALPHTTAAFTGDGPILYHFVLRKRNQHNILSQNLRSFILEIDASDDQVSIKPSNPVEIAIVPAADGAVHITANYYGTQDAEANKADVFLVYLTSNGVDPVPGVDSPVEVAMTDSDGVIKLDYTSGTFADGLTMKVIVQTRNSGTPDKDSDNLVVLSTISDTDGPVAPEGSIFFGKVGEQNDV